ncbi:J domain-containing protein [Sandaracinobacteroides hominis]|uniref:J domain-containing protein n=1 Tax=Sandaracinobacteroides hominis TaxID=2780086 RepID=UPI001F2128EF|nr:DnaJ domain-containing protein [Sandaracinobacteroides hominis]
MAMFLLLAAAAVGYAWWKGWLGKGAERKLGAVAATILALWLLARGQVVPGLAAGVVAAGLGLSGWMQAKVAAVPMDELEARRLLGVGLNADEDEILAAHRRLIAKVHPDRGGNPEMARRVNAARDYLIVNRARRG